MQPILALDRARVFYDGLFSEPRLQHPEGVAVDNEGYVWCGTETGDILRLDKDGTALTRVASTGGFILGLAFDTSGHLYACDLKHACVYRLTVASGKLERFTDAGIKIPNFPVVDLQRHCLYVSDSFHFSQMGPGIWRFDLGSGEGELWFDKPMVFANGMALAADRNGIYVAETFAKRIRRITIGPDGWPGNDCVFVDDLPGYPDGLALDKKGNIYVGCYEPSRLLRIDLEGKTEIYLDDPTAHMLCHPTNCAFHGTTLYLANLGRWHITALESDTVGLPLPVA